MFSRFGKVSNFEALQPDPITNVTDSITLVTSCIKIV